MKLTVTKVLMLLGLTPLIAGAVLVGYQHYSQDAFASTVSKEIKSEATAIELPNKLDKYELLDKRCSKDFYGGGPRCSNHVYLYFGGKSTPEATVKEATSALKAAGWQVEEFKSLTDALSAYTQDIQRNPLLNLDKAQLSISKKSAKGVEIRGYIHMFHKTTTLDSSNDHRGDLQRLFSKYPEYDIIYQISTSTDYVSKKNLK